MANIIISPAKYVQGKGELTNIAQYATKLGKKPFILISEGGKKRVGGIIEDSFKDTGCELVFEAFHGECSKNEINRLVAIVKEKGCDLVIGVGGGKIFDTAKAVAYYVESPVIVCPTIAATDAPCSALTVVYTDDGVFEEYLWLPANPNLVLVDTDIGLRNLDVVMGLENRIVCDIVDVVEGKCKLRQALIKDKRFKELYLLPAAQTRDKSAVNEEQMKELTGKLKEEFDYILIDCPAGIEQGFKNAIAGATRAIVVTTAEISSIRDADRIVGLLESSEIKNPELVINRIRPNMVRKGEMMDVDDIVDLLSIDLIGVVPDDEYIITQTNKGEPVIQNKKAPSGKAYLEIAKRILGENIEATIPGREKGFWAKLKRLFKK